MRRLYETVSSAGITIARLIEYATDLDEVAPTYEAVSRDVPTDFSFETVHTSDQHRRNLDIDFSLPVKLFQDEWAVVARRDDEPVGRALVSAGQQPYVEPLGRGYTFDGAYIRRVYVDPGWRNYGIATHLVAESLAVAKTECNSRRAFAMIAPDNKPSRGAFECNGFEPVRQHDYVSVFGREWRRTSTI